jgi:guanidinopropionase
VGRGDVEPARRAARAAGLARCLHDDPGDAWGDAGQTPFKTMHCADMGDVAMSPVDQDEALAAAEAAVSGMLADGIRPVMVGGDHLCTLTVLRALRKHRGEAFGLVLLDSHTDLYPPYFGGKTLTHGNPFRQAIEEGCLDPHRTFMAGMRGTSYNKEDIDYGREKGVHIVEIEECMARGWTSVMEEARAVVGDGADLCELRHRLHRSGLCAGHRHAGSGRAHEFRGAAMRAGAARAGHHRDDLVEVSPPFDPSGGTCWLGASVMFELICAMER